MKINRSKLDPPTIKLEMGRRSMTTSIIILPTLVPLVMCFNCFKGNILVIKNKSLIIVQATSPTFFIEVLKHKKLEEFAVNYNFYLKNKLVKNNQQLDKGNHFIYIRSKLKGGDPETERKIVLWKGFVDTKEKNKKIEQQKMFCDVWRHN
jgi:hypothetical protein